VAGEPTTPAGWDAYVRANPRATYLQTTAWADVKRPTGWQARLIVGTSAVAGTVGAQVLVQRLPVVPWTFGYAPRGPLLDAWTGRAIEAWTHHLRAVAGPDGGLSGVALLRIDPEVEEGSRLDDGRTVAAGLQALGWRQVRDVQPRTTRIIDLRADEAALWSDLRKKWRQYINKARSNGIVVRDVDAATEPAAFDTFHAVMKETSRRAGVPIRAASAYRTLWAAFQPTGESRLLFAEDPAGVTQAVLLLVSCGGRVVEPYGGMTSAGGESRANYLLKWEAIRSSRERRAVSYDLWGLVHPGISHFKHGFGGREIRYVGAWDLGLSTAGAPALRLGEVARRAVRGVRRRQGSAPAADGDDA
jgi:lipid II:glycine glycyltransferase (peptidoglycan interpeptide bridge formation enzyme)